MNAPEHRPRRRPVIGCVSFLNATPLIDSLDDQGDVEVRYDVPSGLLDDLLAGEVDLALCPVIDYQRSPRPLVVVPVGGIGCDGPTFTVRLFSRVPPNEIAQVHADTDSHTSVTLMRLILRERFHHDVDVVDYSPAHLESPSENWPETLLLIGDKVVTRQPSDRAFPHQLDLGEAWAELTGLPFVFAVWMAHVDRDLGETPALLERTRRVNAARIDQIVAAHADRAGWPHDLAANYLGNLLKYEIGPRQLQAMQRFWALAGEHDLINPVRPLRLHPPSASAAVS